MKIHNFHTKEPWFSLIRQGVKTVEGRKATHLFKKIKAGDQILFTNGTEKFMAVVEDVRLYPSVEKYLEETTLEKALPGINTMEEALEIHYLWSAKDNINEFGFLGIFVKPIAS
ncbi:MAG: ASCH domain-containing protein [Parachlamydiaceae bacterium]|nr:ASCH domain-containing protein [Parachlamydiaceae bacterium]